MLYLVIVVARVCLGSGTAVVAFSSATASTSSLLAASFRHSIINFVGV